MPRKRPTHPLVRQLLRDFRQHRLAPLVATCARCGPGYLVGDTWYATGRRAYRSPIGWAACPWCRCWQAIWAPFQTCFNGRCKRVIHHHLTAAATWQAIVVQGRLEWQQ